MSETEAAREGELRTFFQAIKERDLERVSRLGRADPSLVSGFDPDDCCGATAMNVAVRLRDTELLEALLELGANPDQESDWPPGPFKTLHSIPDDCLDTLGPYLLEHGATLDAWSAAKLGKLAELRAMVEADPEVVHGQGPDGQTPLHFSRTVEIAGFLLDRGSALEARCIDHGSTPAEWMAVGRPVVCGHLLDRGARGDVFMYASIGDLSRLQAAVADDPSLLHARVDRRLFPPTPDGGARIYFFTIGEDATLLHAAAGQGHAGIVRWLVEAGLDPDIRGAYDDATPLHIAAWHDRSETIRALAGLGADLDANSGEIHENAPMGWAIVGGASEAVGALVELGAPVRDYYLRDVDGGERGDFRVWHGTPPETYREIRSMLESA